MCTVSFAELLGSAFFCAEWTCSISRNRGVASINCQSDTIIRFYEVKREKKKRRTNLPDHIQCPTDKWWLMHIERLKCSFDEGGYSGERFIGFDSFEHEVQPHRLFGGGDKALVEDGLVKSAIESVRYTLCIGSVMIEVRRRIWLMKH